MRLEIGPVRALETVARLTNCTPTAAATCRALWGRTSWCTVLGWKLILEARTQTSTRRSRVSSRLSPEFGERCHLASPGVNLSTDIADVLLTWRENLHATETDELRVELHLAEIWQRKSDLQNRAEPHLAGHHVFIRVAHVVQWKCFDHWSHTVGRREPQRVLGIL